MNFIVLIHLDLLVTILYHFWLHTLGCYFHRSEFIFPLKYVDKNKQIHTYLRGTMKPWLRMNRKKTIHVFLYKSSEKFTLLTLANLVVVSHSLQRYMLHPCWHGEFCLTTRLCAEWQTQTRRAFFTRSHGFTCHLLSCCHI